ncbi:hypothetical protein HDV05_006058 [Chytridiales sp. JEL 0842]|nr:hypothetical protein HDV05_006058 [Chytridiales sp. JEL 0842]
MSSTALDIAAVGAGMGVALLVGLSIVYCCHVRGKAAAKSNTVTASNDLEKSMVSSMKMKRTMPSTMDSDMMNGVMMQEGDTLSRSAPTSQQAPVMKSHLVNSNSNETTLRPTSPSPSYNTVTSPTRKEDESYKPISVQPRAKRPSDASSASTYRSTYGMSLHAPNPGANRPRAPSSLSIQSTTMMTAIYQTGRPRAASSLSIHQSTASPLYNAGPNTRQLHTLLNPPINANPQSSTHLYHSTIALSVPRSTANIAAPASAISTVQKAASSDLLSIQTKIAMMRLQHEIVPPSPASTIVPSPTLAPTDVILSRKPSIPIPPARFTTLHPSFTNVPPIISGTSTSLGASSVATSLTLSPHSNTLTESQSFNANNNFFFNKLAKGDNEGGSDEIVSQSPVLPRQESVASVATITKA